MPLTKKKHAKGKGKTQSSTDGQSNTKTLVAAFEQGKTASSKPTLVSPSKQKINDELNEVRKSRGRSPVAKLANHFDKSRSPPPRGNSIVEESDASDGKATRGAIDSSEFDGSPSGIAEEEEGSESEEEPAGVSTSLLKSLRPNECLSDDDTVSEGHVSSDAETEEEDVNVAIQSIEEEDKSASVKKAADEDIVFAAQPEDDQKEVGKNEAAAVEKVIPLPPKLQASGELLMSEAEEEESVRWGWLLVGAVVIIGLGFTAFNRLKRRL